MAFKPEDLIAVHPWRKAVFTTYALSLSFFESVVLDGLVRGRTKEALILADAEGVRAGLSEQGAQRVGREYEVEPIAMTGGVFHPKIAALVGDDDSHLVVGSGNLTFNGWGGNFELAEHLHPSFASDAFDDAAMFFMMLAESKRAAHVAGDRCLSLAEDLSRAAIGPRDGAIRLVHSLEGSIGERLAEFADDIGGASRLSVVAPFWDSGAAIDRLCRRLGLDAVHVHAHPGGSVRGTVGSNWPLSPQTKIIPMAVTELADGSDRKLHAKSFEILCKRGRLLVSGSVNATSAALTAGNVEAAVVRIQRERLHGWTFEPATAPAPIAAIESEKDDEQQRTGVLRASLEGDLVVGRVLAPSMTGPATLTRLTPVGDVFLGDIVLDAHGVFELPVVGLEMSAINGGRVVLRVRSGDKVAEGFASLTAIIGLRRIAGKAASSLMAILAGSETPDDVRVLMEWAHDNPGMLMPAIGGWGGPGNSEPKASFIDAKDLWNIQEKHAADPASGSIDKGWTTFIDALLAAMRQKRGAIDRDAEADHQKGASSRPPPMKTGTSAGPKALEIFESVFDAMLPKNAPHEAVLRAFDLASYVCDRLAPDIHPERAHVWLRRLVDAFCANGMVMSRPETVHSAIMALCGSNPDSEGIRAARGRIIRVGGDPLGNCPPDDPAQCFRLVAGDTGTFEPAWRLVGATRTWREQTRLYCDVLQGGLPEDAGFEELLAAVPAEAQAMRNALQSEHGRKKIIILDTWQPACKCHMQLPKIEQAKLRSHGVASAANCCQKVLLWPEEANG